MTRPRAFVSWSSGKDSAWALHSARLAGEFEIVGLLTTTSRASGHERVSMHGVRRELLDAQAEALGLASDVVELPWPCSNADYEAAMQAALARMLAHDASVVVFGDLYLADVRAYRERMLAGTGLRPVFPLWGLDTRVLARTMIDAGVIATLTCVDLAKLPIELLGRRFDASLLADLPEGVDPCGEQGEFHTFVSGGPGMRAIEVVAGEVVARDGFAWIDLEHSGG